jgi:hypothetical protein
MPFQDISEIETDAAYNVALRNVSLVVISSHGKTIRPGGTYVLTGEIFGVNVGPVILDMELMLGRTSNGTSTNSDRKNLTNCEGGIRP